MKKVRLPNLNKKGKTIFRKNNVIIEKDNALNEVRILASVDSPYVVSYKEAFYDKSSSSLCIIMDFASGGDLL